MYIEINKDYGEKINFYSAFKSKDKRGGENI